MNRGLEDGEDATYALLSSSDRPVAPDIRSSFDSGFDKHESSFWCRYLNIRRHAGAPGEAR